MTRTPSLSTGFTALVMGGAAALAFTAPAAAEAEPTGQPFHPEPEQLVEIVPEGPDGGGEGGDPGGDPEEAGAAEQGPGGQVSDYEVVELPDDVWCLLTQTCEDGEGPDGEGQDCELVVTPFGKIFVCDEDEEPEPPQGCEYLLGLDGEWVLDCPDEEPPPEECRYVLGLDGNWVLECPDDEIPPQECRYLLDHDGNWVLECPDEIDPCEDPETGKTLPECEFDPCEDPEDGGTPVGCEEDPGEKPEPADKGGLPLTGTSGIIALVTAAAVLAAAGSGALVLSRRRAQRDENEVPAADA